MNTDEQVFVSKNLPSCSCTHCGYHKVEFRGILKYAYFTIFPLFPMSTHYDIHCLRCSKLSPTEHKENALIPWYQVAIKFIGLIVLALCLLNFGYKYQQAVEKEYQVLAAPEPYDFYLVNQSRFNNEPLHHTRYVVAKVVDVNDKQVKVVFGNYVYMKKHRVVKAIRLDNMLANNYFSKKVTAINKSALTQLRKKEAIYGAYRPENLALFGGLVMRPQQPKAFKGYRPNQVNKEALEFYQWEEYEKAFELFTEAAAKGNLWAQLNLAQMYRDGEGTQRDNEKALHWFKQAALQNRNQESGALSQYNQLCLTVAGCELLK